MRAIAAVGILIFLFIKQAQSDATVQSQAASTTLLPAAGTHLNGLRGLSKVERVSSKKDDANSVAKETVLENDMVFAKPREDVEAAAVALTARKWPEISPGVYEVPYVLNNTFAVDQQLLILWSMELLSRGSNVVFRPRNSSDTGGYLYIQHGWTNACCSYMGYIEPSTNLTLSDICFRPGTILHELMHSLGFMHEHQRPERDSILSFGRDSQALKDTVNFGVSDDYKGLTGYDSYSVMHYPASDVDADGRTKFFFYKDKELQNNQDMKEYRLAMSLCDWHALNTRYPGKKKAPPCVPNTPPDYHLVMRLATRRYAEENEPPPKRPYFGKEFPLSVECALKGFLEFPSLSWIDDLNDLRSPQLSDVTRLRYCREFDAVGGGQKQTQECQRYCKYTCRQDFPQKTLPECMEQRTNECIKRNGSSTTTQPKKR